MGRTSLRRSRRAPSNVTASPVPILAHLDHPNRLRADWLRVAFQNDPTCTYCSRPLTRDPNRSHTATVDHCLPLSRNGADHHTNWAICCSACNQAKGALSASQYVDRLGGLSVDPRFANQQARDEEVQCTPKPYPKVRIPQPPSPLDHRPNHARKNPRPA